MFPCTSWCCYIHIAVLFVVICARLVIQCISFVNLDFIVVDDAPFHRNMSPLEATRSDIHPSNLFIDRSGLGRMSAIVVNKTIYEFIRALIEIVVDLNYINFYQTYYIFSSDCVSA